MTRNYDHSSSACPFLQALFSFLIGFAALLFGQQEPAGDSMLIEFRIKDQFNREYIETSWRDSVLVLFGSDRGGSEFNEPWARAIQDSLTSHAGFSRLRIVALADLRGVPFFMKPIVKRLFPGEKERWILLDWKGHFAESYHFDKDKSNILVFSAGGRLRYQVSVAEFDSSRVDAIVEQISGVLDELNE